MFGNFSGKSLGEDLTATISLFSVKLIKVFYPLQIAFIALNFRRALTFQIRGKPILNLVNSLQSFSPSPSLLARRVFFMKE